MANSTARIFLKTGKSFPQLLRRRLVSQSNVEIAIKEQQLLRSLINPTQKIFEQKPILGDGFNFVDFVLGKDHALCTEQIIKPIAEARGKRVVSDVDEDDDGDDNVYDDDDIEDFDDEDFDDEDFDDDDDDDEDGDARGVRT